MLQADVEQDQQTPVVYHIPVCPFSQRLEILMALKDLSRQVDFRVIDITQPRPDWLLEKTHGTTALPLLDTGEGEVIKESMVILRYLEDRFPEPAVAQREPYRHAVEGMTITMEGDFGAQDYRYVRGDEATQCVDPAERAGNEQEQVEVEGASPLYSHPPESGELSIPPFEALAKGFQVVLTDPGVLWIFAGIGEGYRDKPSLEGPERSTVDAGDMP